MNFRDQSGSLLLEAVLASALLAVFAIAILSLTVTANQGTGKALKDADVVWRAQEGIEALRTIPFDSLSLTDQGSLSWTGSSWTVSSSGPETLAGGITRTVRVKQVERDSNCVIVPTGSGDVDVDTLALESEVSWTDPLGRAQSYTVSSLRTRYTDPQGDCFLAEQASQIGINLTLQAEWFGLKQLRTLYLENLGTEPITIHEIEFTWNNAETMDQMFINSTKVWSSSGPGSPSGPQSSGTEIDIADYTIPGGTSVEINKTQFSGDMRGTTLTLKLEFSDDSEITSDPFTPTW
ncbi:hypothetical protein A3C17_01510 [Candidatus Uhrbacteria bacterium RIFCSPHIGHO2_02_FULL_53_13]|uniref:Uncharacterized protein n=2 Tax=Candidatus Uhriibacteriota TaxID=1752732 RepID=A0A1F7TVJ6_9BACT|nr:MAG: hypothetical protein A3C17_01510 [Candidatus Uhrbacteria bacterium RIFCSPHIGHO2_02_FULL_53_13]OGL89459.1 MAG: hypothetical protein A3I45_02040 [Candidatus Uhrbacteria bacterium RIFCSPLOWO2_02_FULL_53_10]